MRYTLLELTQRILSSMESDEVSDINETQEAVDVVQIIRECYNDIVGQLDLKHNQGVFKLDASTDNTKPVLMTLPTECVNLDWLKYNIGTLAMPDYKNLCYITQQEFLYLQDGLDPSATETKTMDFTVNSDTFKVKFRDDRYPTYYTIFDDRTLIFDAFDSDVENTLTNERSMGYGNLVPEFRLENSWVPDLDPRQFQLLLQDAKSTAHVELKQQSNPKAEAKYRRNRILAQRTRDDNRPSHTRQTAHYFGRSRVGRRPFDV